MSAKFVRGNAVWAVHSGIVSMQVSKVIVNKVAQTESGGIYYTVRLSLGRTQFLGDHDVFATEREACASAYKRTLLLAESFRKRAGIRDEKPRAKPKATTIRIPERFYTDHLERDLDTPEDIGDNARYAVVRSDDPALAELLNDAEFYAHPFGPDAGPKGVTMSAKATVRAIRDVIGWDDAEPAIQRLRKEGAR